MNSEQRAAVCSRVLVMFLLASLPTLTARAENRIRAVRSPVEHSTSDLIDAAFSAGQIDSETALIYKVFAAFGDCRLPPQFVGNTPPLPDSDVVLEVRSRLANLSAATKATLQPFLLPPSAHGSWVELDTNCVNRRFSKLGAEAFSTVDWTVLETQNQKATVRYENRFPEDAPRAQVIRQAIDAIWTPLTSYFQREPLSDKGDFGEDARLDVFLSPIEDPKRRGEYAGFFYSPDCFEGSGYLSINTAVGNAEADDRLRAVHELTHAILASYKGDRCQDYRWLNEATATWAEHYIYPDIFDRLGAPQFLADPSLPLETYQGLHQYGAYLFLFYLERGLPQPSLIRLIWEGSSEPDSLADIDNVLSAEQWGGLKKVWPQFARYNWNQEPVDDYHRWDPLPTPFALTAAETRGERIIADSKTTETTLAPKSPLRHLSAQYFHLHAFGQASLLFLNGWTYEADKNLVDIAQTQALLYTSVPPQEPKDTIRVEALAKINGQWQKYVGSGDWTNTSFKGWCHDLTSERVDELVVIVSNSEFHDRNNTYAPAKLPLVLFETNMACGEWKGSAKMQVTWPSGDAAVTQSSNDLKWKRSASDVGVVPFKNGFGVTGWSYVAEGTIDWNAQGWYPLIPPDRCTLTGSGSFDAANAAALAMLNFLPPGSDLYRRYIGSGIGASLPTFNVICPGTPVTPSTMGPWFLALTDSLEFPTVSNDGKTLKGTHELGGQIQHYSYTWNFVAAPPQ